MLDHTVAAPLSKFQAARLATGSRVAHPEVVNAIGNLINTNRVVQPPSSSGPPGPPWSRTRCLRDDQRDSSVVERRAAGGRPGGDRRSRGRPLLPAPSTSFPTSGSRQLPGSAHGLALYLLEDADEQFGVACLGGESFGAAGRGLFASVAQRLTSGSTRRWPSSPKPCAAPTALPNSSNGDLNSSSNRHSKISRFID